MKECGTQTDILVPDAYVVHQGEGAMQVAFGAAEIARDAGRATLARNFERAAELVNVPQDFVMQIYELLRPGRAKSKQQLVDAARIMRETHKAESIARFIEEAAETYEERGLFTYRF